MTAEDGKFRCREIVEHFALKRFQIQIQWHPPLCVTRIAPDGGNKRPRR
jgi:hypothetical protein